MDGKNLIIICTEPSFEWKSRLLVRSIRTFGGDLSSTRIVSYSPRPDRKPSRVCLDEFRSLDVEVVTIPLNLCWPTYGLANKIVACSHAERALNAKKIAFLDSDQIILSNFDSLFEMTAPFAARPVDLRNIGVLGSGDYEGEYWNDLYAICGVTHIRTIETTVCSTIIREYFDSGMFAVEAKAGILGAWKDNFAQIWKKGLRPRSGNYFIEQSCLSATVSSVAERVSVLPNGYNLPIETHYYKRFVSSQSRPVALNPVSLHYRGLLDELPLHETTQFCRTFMDHDRCLWLLRNVEELQPNAGKVARRPLVNRQRLACKRVHPVSSRVVSRTREQASHHKNLEIAATG